MGLGQDGCQLKLKNRISPQDMAGGKRGNSRSRQHGYKIRRFPCPIYFFHSKYHSCQRRVKCGCNPGPGSAGHQAALLVLSPPEKSGDTLSGHGSQLDGWSAPSQRHSAEDAQKASRKLCRYYPHPTPGQCSGNLRLHLRNPPARDQRLPPQKPSHHNCQQQQYGEPACKPGRILIKELKHFIQPLCSIAQANPI